MINDNRSLQTPSPFTSAPVDTAETLHQGRFLTSTPYYSASGDEDHLSPSSAPARSYTGYPEYVAQSHIRDGASGVSGHRISPPCPEWAVVGRCEDGSHQFAKSVICNREWCNYCGGDRDLAHMRRIAAKLPRARQMKTMGRFIFTIPPEIRDRYRDPRRLSALGVSIKRMLQGQGYRRGFRRWHFFGEDHPGSDMQGDGPRPYHPHLEVIAEGGYLPQSRIAEIKRSLGRILGITNWQSLNIYYRYLKADAPAAKRYHWVKYMLRPTFEDAAWDYEMAGRLVGFKNSVSWGRWAGDVAWDMPASETEVTAVVALQSGVCPVDGSAIHWGGTIDYRIVMDNREFWEDMGGGYSMAELTPAVPGGGS